MSFVSAGSPPLPEPSSATMVAGFPPPRIDECRQLPLRPALSSDAPSSAADTRSNRSDYDCVPAAGRIAAALTTLPKPEHPTASSAAALTSWLHDAVSAGQAVAGTSPDALAAVALPFGSAKAALTGARDDLPLHHHHHYQQQHHQHQHPLHMHQRQLGHLNNSNISNTNNQSQPRQHFAHRPLQPQSQSQSQPQSQLQSQQHLIVSSLHQTHPSYSSFRSPVPSVQQPEYAGTPQGHLSAFQSFAHPPPPPPGISSRCRMSVQFPTEAQTPPLASPDADFQSTCRDVDQGSMVRSDSAVLASASHGHLPRLSNQLLLGHSRTGAAASTTSLPPLDPSILALVPTSAAAAAAPTSSSPSSTTPSSHLAVQERHHHFAAAEQGVTATSGAHVDASAFAALRAEMSSGHAIRSQSGYSKATSPPPSLPPVPTSGLALASHASPTKMAQRQPYQQSFIRRTGRSPSPPRQIYAQQHSADVPQTPAIAPSMGPTPSPPNSFSGKHGRSSSLPPSSGHVPFQRSSSLPPIPVPAPRRPGPEPPTTSATAASTPVVPVAGARAAATPDVIAHVRALLSAPRASGPPQPVGGISGLTFEELIDSSTAPAEPSRAPETARELLMAGRRVSGVVTRPAIDDEHARRAEVQYPNSGNKAAVGGPNPSPMGSLATLPPPSASLCLRCATAVHHYAAGNPAHLAAFVVMVSGLCPACISTVLACEYVPRPLVAVTRRALVAGGCGLVHQDTLVVVPEDLFVRLEQHLSPRGMISAPEPGFSAQQQQFQLQHYQHQQRQHALYRHHYHYHGRGPRQDSGAAIDSPPVNPGPSSRAGATLGSFAGLAMSPLPTPLRRTVTPAVSGPLSLLAGPSNSFGAALGLGLSLTESVAAPQPSDRNGSRTSSIASSTASSSGNGGSAGTSNGGVSSNGSAIAMPFIGADLRQVAVSNNFVNKQYSAAALGGADEQCSFMSAAEQFALSPLSSPRFGLRSMLPSPIVVEPVTAQPTADVAVGSRALEHRPLSHGVHLALDSPAMSIDALASSLGQTASPDASMLSDMDVDDPEDDDNDGDALSLDFRLRPSIHKPPVAPDSWIARPPHPLAVDPIEAMPILGGCFSRLDAVKDRPRWVAGALRHRPRRLGGKESRVSASIERLHGALTTDISTDVPQYASAAAAAPRHRTVRRVALEGEPRPAVSASRWVPSSDGSLAAHSARSAAAPLPPPLSAASLPNLAPLLGAAAVRTRPLTPSVAHPLPRLNDLLQQKSLPPMQQQQSKPGAPQKPPPPVPVSTKAVVLALSEEDEGEATLFERMSLLRFHWCRFCGVTASPNWRRGPWAAKQTLCNRCGVAYGGHAGSKKKRLHIDEYETERIEDRISPIVQEFCFPCQTRAVPAPDGSGKMAHVRACAGCEKGFHPHCIPATALTVAGKGKLAGKSFWFCSLDCLRRRQIKSSTTHNPYTIVLSQPPVPNPLFQQQRPPKPVSTSSSSSAGRKKRKLTDPPVAGDRSSHNHVDVRPAAASSSRTVVSKPSSMETRAISIDVPTFAVHRAKPTTSSTLGGGAGGAHVRSRKRKRRITSGFSDDEMEADDLDGDADFVG